MVNILRLRSDHWFWKALLTMQVFATTADLYRMVTEPAILQPTHPILLSVGVFLLDQLVLLANVGVIISRRFFEMWVWQCTLIMFPISTFSVLFYEFSAGGYSTSDMGLFSIGLFWTLLLFLLPVFKLLNDDKEDVRELSE
ncbi:hypothetical protein [Thalassotalea ganghwensis]